MKINALGDFDRMLTMFSSLNLSQSDSMHVITIPGAPWSKARPRFGKGRTYASRDDQDAEKRTATYMRQAVRAPYLGNVGLACLFYRPNYQRIDTDNLIKHVCDAANGVLWRDDSQCTAIMGVIELDADNPRTIIAVGAHVSTLKRGINDVYTCAVCKKECPRSQRARPKPPKTCSIECSMILRGYQSLAEPIPCAHCGNPFRRTTKTQTLCSKDCQVESLRNRRRSAGKPQSRCSECGVTLGHKRGGRCRDCWRNSPSGPVSEQPSLFRGMPI